MIRPRDLAAAIVMLATAAWDWPSWMEKVPHWAPLTAEEIADAHTCVMDSMVAICAGTKRIATGIIVTPQKVGSALSSDARVEDFSSSLLPVNTARPFTVHAQVQIKQNIVSGGPEWEAIYYVIDNSQLENIIAKARAEPDWKP